MRNMKTDFYKLAAKEYHADPCPTPSLSSSVAVDLVTKSPAHARLRHPRLCPATEETATEETGAMSFGSVVHELLLGEGGGFAIWEGDSWRGKEASVFRACAIEAGQSPIKRADYARANTLAESAREQLKAFGLDYVFKEGVSEHVAIWQDGGHYMRAMFDRHIPERREIWDIKTTGKLAHPEQIARTVAAMNYDMRSEFYLMGAEKITGIPARKGGYGFCFLFIETEPPFAVVPCFLDEAFRTRGRMRAKEAIDIWVRCMDSGKWPSYVNGPVEIAAPGWVDHEIEETGISASGAQIV